MGVTRSDSSLNFSVSPPKTPFSLSVDLNLGPDIDKSCDFRYISSLKFVVSRVKIVASYR